ncbi:hypothetical protein GT002_35750, partial [Streptomyces sp. SID4917]
MSLAVAGGGGAEELSEGVSDDGVPVGVVGGVDGVLEVPVVGGVDGLVGGFGVLPGVADEPPPPGVEPPPVGLSETDAVPEGVPLSVGLAAGAPCSVRPPPGPRVVSAAGWSAVRPLSPSSGSVDGSVLTRSGCEVSLPEVAPSVTTVPRTAASTAPAPA